MLIAVPFAVPAAAAAAEEEEEDIPNSLSKIVIFLISVTCCASAGCVFSLYSLTASVKLDRSLSCACFGESDSLGLYSSGVYICKSVGNDLKHGNFTCKLKESYLTYEHSIEIPVEFTYINQ
jgi:hypothetical protein